MQAARQVEVSGGLRDRLSTLLGSDSPAQIGSADWEARIEITKIEGEQRLALAELAQPAVSSTERGSLQNRLNEPDVRVNHALVGQVCLDLLALFTRFHRFDFTHVLVPQNL